MDLDIIFDAFVQLGMSPCLAQTALALGMFVSFMIATIWFFVDLYKEVENDGKTRTSQKSQDADK